MTQDQINALLVEQGTGRAARGAPQGGRSRSSSAAAERSAKPWPRPACAFEVVPGITAAIAAPAYAGIPVTHRDFNSSFTLLTGHEKEEAYRDAAARQPRARGGIGSGLAGAREAAVPGVLHGREIAAANLPEADRARHASGHAGRHDSVGHDAAAADGGGHAGRPARSAWPRRGSRRRR